MRTVVIGAGIAGLTAALMLKEAGADVTVITYGSLVDTALAAADLADDHDLEVIDLRSLNPLDFDTIADSVRRTGRCVVMHEGPRTLGFGAELAARTVMVQDTVWPAPRRSVARTTTSTGPT